MASWGRGAHRRGEREDRHARRHQSTVHWRHAVDAFSHGSSDRCVTAGVCQHTVAAHCCTVGMAAAGLERQSITPNFLESMTLSKTTPVNLSQVSSLL